MSSTTPAHQRKKRDEEKVLIRPWPKVVFLYPTLVVSLVGWFVQLIGSSGENYTGSATIGLIWFLVFAANLLVFSFDFSRIKSITLVVAVVALLFVGLWANQNWGVFGPLKDWWGRLDIRMSTQFYGINSVFFCFMFLLVFVNTRFNYYEVNRNEILHHHGNLGDINRTPTTALRMHKEIYDLLEYALLRSGRMIFYLDPARGDRHRQRDQDQRRRERIKNLLSSVSVYIDAEEEDASTNVPM
ncbi:MAG: hypothetical protein R3F30_08630 [Planctomycetota bacterium]